MPFSNFYYLIVTISRVHTLFSFLTIVAAVIFILVTWAVIDLGDRENYKYATRSGLILFFVSIIAIFTPSKEDMIVMYSGDKLESIITSDKAKELGGKAYDVIDAAMSDYLKDHSKGK